MPMTCPMALSLHMSKLVSEAKQEGSKPKIAGCTNEARSKNTKTYGQGSKTHMTFHYTDWFIGILIMTY